MPLLRFDLVEGRTPAALQTLLDAAHDAVLEAFGVPHGDRYQIVTEHPATHLIVEDTGLGIPRTDNRVVLQVTSMPREPEMKQKFYRLLCEKLKDRCGIEDTDIMVSMVGTAAADWSFGHGRAQFLTGEL
jgi:hypothetical protein